MRLTGTLLAIVAILPLCLGGMAGWRVCIHACGEIELNASELAEAARHAHGHGESDHCAHEHGAAGVSLKGQQDGDDVADSCAEAHCPEQDPCVDLILGSPPSIQLQSGVKPLDLATVPCPLGHWLAAADAAPGGTWWRDCVPRPGYPEFLRTIVLRL